MAPLRNSRSRNCSGSEYRAALKRLESKSTQAIEIPFRPLSQIQDRSGVLLYDRPILRQRSWKNGSERTESNIGLTPKRIQDPFLSSTDASRVRCKFGMSL